MQVRHMPALNRTSIRRVEAQHHEMANGAGRNALQSFKSPSLYQSTRCVLFFSRKYPKCTYTACKSVEEKLMMDKVFPFFFVLKIKKFPEGKQVEGPLRVSSSDSSRRKMWESNIQIASNL